MVTPQPGKTVGLQFQADRQRIRLGLAETALCTPDLVADTQQVLYMVPDLVGDDIGLGKVTGGTVLLFQVLRNR
jgi:hypothetical protein